MAFQRGWSALFGSGSDDQSESQNSTDEGHLSITVEEERPEAEQLEINADHETEGLRDEFESVTGCSSQTAFAFGCGRSMWTTTS